MHQLILNLFVPLSVRQELWRSTREWTALWFPIFFFHLDNAILFETAKKAHPSFFIIIPCEYRLKCLKSCDLICPFKQGVSFLDH